jgi:hypothetical protein
MQLQKVTVQHIKLPRYRIVRGFDSVVRVDIPKAQEAMRYAMGIRENLRALDVERNELIGLHAR